MGFYVKTAIISTQKKSITLQRFQQRRNRVTPDSTEVSP